MAAGLTTPIDVVKTRLMLGKVKQKEEEKEKTMSRKKKVRKINMHEINKKMGVRLPRYSSFLSCTRPHTCGNLLCLCKCTVMFSRNKIISQEVIIRSCHGSIVILQRMGQTTSVGTPSRHFSFEPWIHVYMYTLEHDAQERTRVSFV